MKYLIFDFDGVLGDTIPTWVDLLSREEGSTREDAIAFLNHYFEEPRHTRRHDIDPIKFSQDLVITRRRAKMMNEVGFGLFEEFIMEVGKLTGVKTAVVSSGSADYIKPKLSEAAFDPTHILTIEDHHSKEEKIEIICRDWGVDIYQVSYFTDTRADVIELKELLHPTKIFGCTWGFHSYERLREVLPENQILKEFPDIHTVI
jgi:phosphoglycolate phosphatase-like HAD superfamily hydrolase